MLLFPDILLYCTYRDTRYLANSLLRYRVSYPRLILIDTDLYERGGGGPNISSGNVNWEL